MRQTRLATTCALRLAIVIGASMVVHAILEHWLDPDRSWLELLARHGWHVMALGLLGYAILFLGFDRLVGVPLHALHAHLYRVATGRLDLLHLETRSIEFAGMVSSVNLLVRRMRLGAGDSDPHRTALALRDIASRLRDQTPEAAEAIVSAAAALDAIEIGRPASRRAGGRDLPRTRAMSRDEPEVAS